MKITLTSNSEMEDINRQMAQGLVIHPDRVWVEIDGGWELLSEKNIERVLSDLEDAPEPFNGADPAKFDHDGDGLAGGSKPKAKARKAK